MRSSKSTKKGIALKFSLKRGGWQKGRSSKSLIQSDFLNILSTKLAPTGQRDPIPSFLFGPPPFLHLFLLDSCVSRRKL